MTVVREILATVSNAQGAAMLVMEYDDADDGLLRVGMVNTLGRRIAWEVKSGETVVVGRDEEVGERLDDVSVLRVKVVRRDGLVLPPLGYGMRTS